MVILGVSRRSSAQVVQSRVRVRGDGVIVQSCISEFRLSYTESIKIVQSPPTLAIAAAVAVIVNSPPSSEPRAPI